MRNCNIMKVSVCALLYLIQFALCVYKTNFNDPASLQLDTYRNAHKEQVQLVSAYGRPLDDINATLSAGKRGPLLIEDITFFERLSHIARERIPERIVHAKGAGAFGTFIVTKDVKDITKALFLSEVGKETRVAARFSTSLGSIGSPDTVRDLRGIAVKFYTEEGNFDLLTLSTPTFFIRDPMMFPQVIHAFKRNPATNLRDFNMFWDFVSQTPETLLQILYLYGEKGIPDCYRHTPGFSANTYKLVNETGQVVYVKLQLNPGLGFRGLSNEEALNRSITDPDYCVRDLYNAIAMKQYPKWTLGIQLMTEDEAQKSKFNPFDVTKVWPEEQFPFREIGELVLTKNPDNYFEEVEQIGFNPGRLVPGIEVSVDKLLQGRTFIYGDTQVYRLGPNFQQLPVNKPSKQVANYERDGPQVFTNQGSAPNYFPNRFGGPSPSSIGYISKYNYPCGYVQRYYEEDNYSEPKRLYAGLDKNQKELLVNNLVTDIKKAMPEIQKSVVDVFSKIGDLGKQLEQRLNE